MQRSGCEELIRIRQENEERRREEDELRGRLYFLRSKKASLKRVVAKPSYKKEKDEKKNPKGESELMMACMSRESQEKFEKLLEDGSNPNLPDKAKNSILSVAVRYFQTEKVKTLLIHRADFNSPGGDGNAMIHDVLNLMKKYAQREGSERKRRKILKMFEYAVDVGVNMEIENKSSKTGIQLLSELENKFENCEEVKEMLSYFYGNGRGNVPREDPEEFQPIEEAVEQNEEAEAVDVEEVEDGMVLQEEELEEVEIEERNVETDNEEVDDERRRNEEPMEVENGERMEVENEEPIEIGNEEAAELEIEEPAEVDNEQEMEIEEPEVLRPSATKVFPMWFVDLVATLPATNMANNDTRLPDQDVGDPVLHALKVLRNETGD